MRRPYKINKKFTSIVYPPEYTYLLKEELKCADSESEKNAVWDALIMANSFNLLGLCAEIISEKNLSDSDELYEELFQEGMLLLFEKLNKLKKSIAIENITSSVLFDGIKESLAGKI